MWEIEGICVAGYLVPAIWMDVKKRRIPVWYLAAGSILVLMLQMIGQKEEMIAIGLGVGVGIGFLLLSKLCQQGIGYGDSWMILNLGIFLGVWKLFVLLMGAFISASLVCGIGMWKKKLKRKSRIPFLPFLALGYLSVCFW